MTHRTFDEQIANFNRVVSSWDINQEYKVALLGMIASLGYEHEKSITPEPHWIPVTENTLPEDGIPVNVTWVNRKPEFYYSEIKDKPYTATAIYFRGKWFWYSCVIEDWLAEYGSNESFLANLQEAVDRDIEITAWMPLPEPYKGVTE